MQTLIVNPVDARDPKKGFVVVLLTREELLSAGVNGGKLPQLQQSLNAHPDPRVAFQNYADFWGVTVVPWKSVQSITWVKDTSHCEVWLGTLTPSGKRKRVKLVVGSPENQSLFLQEARQRLPGKFEKTTQPASIWHVGSGPLVFGVVTLWLGAVLIWAASQGYRDPSTVGSGRRRATAQMVTSIANTLGLGGSVALVVAVLAGLSVWWYLLCQKRPNQHTVSITSRTPPPLPGKMEPHAP